LWIDWRVGGCAAFRDKEEGTRMCSELGWVNMKSKSGGRRAALGARHLADGVAGDEAFIIMYMLFH
jgi:hypothetical protein